MSNYFHAPTNETRDFDDDWFAAAVAVGNPKVAGWTIRPAAPSHSSTQHPPQWVNGAWVVRDKTAEELAAEAAATADTTERQLVRAMIAKLQAGTATAAEQRRCLIYLLRQLQP